MFAIPGRGWGGHVVIAVRGTDLTGFVNTALARGILLWNVRRQGAPNPQDAGWAEKEGDLLYARVAAARLGELRNVAVLTGCRFTIQERTRPLFLWRRLVRRRFLAVGLLGVLAVLYLLSGFVWSIRVSGNRRVPATVILQAAAAGGLAWGMPRRSLDAGRVEKAIRDRVPQVAWVGVKLAGTCVCLQVVEKSLPRAVSQVPADIVAARSGLVSEVLVQKGRAVVKPGDTVRRGQVLISGVLPPPEGQKGEPGLVAARGLVRARVWYEGYGSARIVATGERPAGPSVSRYSINVGGREIIAVGPTRSPFPLFRTETVTKTPSLWRNIGLPVELVITRYVAYEKYREVRDPACARRLAATLAFFDLESTRFPVGTVVDRRVFDMGVPGRDNVVRERMQVETAEDIGVVRPL